jgi:hypothetical protein
MTVYLVICLPKIPYIHRIYMVLANFTLNIDVQLDAFAFYMHVFMLVLVCKCSSQANDIWSMSLFSYKQQYLQHSVQTAIDLIVLNPWSI